MLSGTEKSSWPLLDAALEELRASVDALKRAGELDEARQQQPMKPKLVLIRGGRDA
ncbi:MAG: hypothetical protein ABIP53_02475 [Candidatus Limnocylindrales bacterium]